MRFPLDRKIALLIAAVAAGGTLLLGAGNVYRQTRLAAARAGERLVAIVSTGAAAIEGERAARAGSVPAAHEELCSMLRAFRDVNALGGGGLSLMRPDGRGGFAYVASAQGDHCAAPGTPFTTGAAEALALMNRIVADGLPSQAPRWLDPDGAWLSAFAPVRGRGGEVVALLGADLARGDLVGEAGVSARTIALDALVAALVAALLGGLLARRIVAPIRRVTDRMQLIADGGADLTQELATSTADEVNELVVGFNRAVRGLRAIVGAVQRTGGRAVDGAAAGSEVARRLREGSRGQIAALEQGQLATHALDRATSTIALASDQLDASAHEVTSAVLGMEHAAVAAQASVSRMNDSISTTASSIGQLNGAIQTINRNVGSLSETAEDVTASVSQLDASLREINRFTEETAVFSVTTREAAEAGREAVSATAQGMTEIEQHTRRVNDTMVGLARFSDEIGDIVQVIRSVAERTNLLALNAAIIAARAGEQGQGFQVVAQEIRDLAERTRISTADIASLITRVQRESAEAVQIVALQAESVSRGRQLAAEALGELDRIGGVADETSSRIERIVKRAEEQTLASQKVLAGVERIHDTLQLITHATREQSQASAAAQRAAGQLKDDSHRTTRAMADQAGQFRGIAQTIERMTERIGGIKLQTRGQSGDAQRLERGMTEALAVAESFSDEAHRLDEAMSGITDDVATLSAEVTRFKIA